MTGAGDILKSYFDPFGINVCDGCSSLRQRMNENGPQWCREHFKSICDAIEGRANRKKRFKLLPNKRMIIEWAVRRAITKAESGIIEV